MLTLIIKFTAMLPTIPNSTKGLNVLSHSRSRRGPADAESSKIMPLHLTTDSQRKTSIRRSLEVPSDICGCHRAASEGDRDKLVGKVQERYGKDKDEAEKEVNEWIEKK